ncbi:ankyrin repeat and EF-hand domain-containing protein 1 [Silurus asotus]|uniref:Ankyrin repeat and EF-hand domain-containing protein 1 n=1 Tax=Silurus asotus TaxID=30991 RepID=A0AAD5A6G8_SILAS|nr:ankyrin repeat and EF-hand domain-containing protein 1 [Silurus asotus]
MNTKKNQIYEGRPQVWINVEVCVMKDIQRKNVQNKLYRSGIRILDLISRSPELPTTTTGIINHRMSEGGGVVSMTKILKIGAVAESRLEVLQIYKLLQLVRERNKAQLEKMVRLGISNLINLTEPNEGTGVLHLTSISNDLDTAEFLLSLGAHPDVQDKRGRTPVLLAAELGYDAMLDLLAKNHADMRLVDNEGKGVLFYCISPSQRHTRCLQVALNSNADVNNTSNVGKPVFLLACEHAKECENICMRILESGADPNATDQLTGRTALMEAARAGSVALVRGILQRSGNPNTSDKLQQNATQFAAAGGFFQARDCKIIYIIILRLLSAYQADLNAVCVEGNSALHVCAAGGHTECCRFLAQRGCNPKLKNTIGLVPRQIAKAHGHKAAVKELQKAEQAYTKFSKPGVVNPNQLWALTLHDWSCEHEEELRNSFQLAEETSTPVEKVSNENFAHVLLKHNAPIDQEHMQKIITDHDKKHEGVININEFFKGLQYLHKAFVPSSYEPKTKGKKSAKGKKGGKRKVKKGKSVVPLPICTLPPDIMEKRPDGGPRFMIESYQPFTDTKRFNRDRPPSHPVEDDSAWYVDEPQKIYTNINRCVRTEDFESLCLAFRQSCLEIAQVYGDERIIHLVKSKFNNLPKRKDNKRGKGRNVGAAPEKAASPTKETEKSTAEVLPHLKEKRVNLKEHIITVNQNVSISSNTRDTHFTPKTVWGRRLASSAEHVERRVDRRNHLSYEVDFRDFVMPFNKNLMRKLREVGVAEDE